MQQLECKLLSLKRHHFLLFFIGITILVIHLSTLIVDLSGIEIQERKEYEITIWFVVVALILAPSIETLFFQKWPIDFFEDRFKRKWPLILISAIPFGVGHYINEYFIRDFFYAFLHGVIFAYAYILCKIRDDPSPYLVVVLIHMGYNLYVIILNLIII